MSAIVRPHSILALGLALALALPAAAVAAPEKSLNKCQQTVKKEADKFIAKKLKALRKCLGRISTLVIQNDEPTLAEAAKPCAVQLAKVVGAEDKMRTKITARCDPDASDHTIEDLRGPGATVAQSLAVRNVDAYCAAYIGDAMPDALDDWLDCLVAASDCAANAATAAHVPRTLEFLDLLRPEVAALLPEPTDALAVLDTTNDAIEGEFDDDIPHIQCGPSTVMASGQTVAYPADINDGIVGPVAVPDDGTSQLGLAPGLIDNGDGTVSDVVTGLMWEKKGDDGGLHDQDDTYRWDSDTGFQETIWDWLEDVNTEGGTGFAGFDDWRIPTVRELQTIVDYGASSPAVSPLFNAGCVPACTPETCSCTTVFNSWTSTTLDSAPNNAFAVVFDSGVVDTNNKLSERHVRAVRGGH